MRRKGIRIAIYDPIARKSFSLTVYHDDARSVAQLIENALHQKWAATSLSDKRHRRR